MSWIETISDFFGTPIGKLNHLGDADNTVEVSDWFGTPLGKADNNGTRDFLGTPISPNNVPGLLFSSEFNSMARKQPDTPSNSGPIAPYIEPSIDRWGERIDETWKDIQRYNEEYKKSIWILRHPGQDYDKR